MARIVYDDENLTVNGVSISGLPQKVRDHFAMRGIALFLSRNRNQDRAWARLMDGSAAARHPGRVAGLEGSLWRRAIADVRALAVARSTEGVKPGPGKKWQDTDAYKAALDAAAAAVASWSTDKLARAKHDPAVILRHAELSGRAVPGVSALFD